MFTCKNLYVPTPNSAFNIISDASVYFEDGEMNAVIGPSGCGKTTLIKAMLGMGYNDDEVYTSLTAEVWHEGSASHEDWSSTGKQYE